MNTDEILALAEEHETWMSGIDEWHQRTAAALREFAALKKFLDEYMALKEMVEREEKLPAARRQSAHEFDPYDPSRMDLLKPRK